MRDQASGAIGADVELATRPRPGSGLPDGLLALGCEVTGGEARVSFTGELDVASADQAFCYVRDVIDRYHTPVVLDVAGLSFCDARGLAALLRMSRHAQQARTSLRLTSPSHRLLQLLRITGLAGLLVTNAPASPASN
jgi:anti-sigma B factor antagonist